MSALFKTILLVFTEILQFIFPLSDDEQRIKGITAEQFAEKLNVSLRNEVIGLAAFKDAEVRAALHLVKFHRHSHAITLTGALLATWLRTQACAGAVIIPIPLSARREKERGFNQVALIATEAIAALPQYSVATNILARQRHTKPQTSLPRAERLKNLTGAFTSKPGVQTLAGQHIILLDDVSTTGATLQAAKATLLPLSPASLTAVAIAH